ncbi:type II CRISPR RNA-guided endonuclease Cas9 [uncultured Dialister sp.]|uniref:type II CRISPR RNA-guided endonuclease Cas9 n=1 Tax=uncultured Dialister sp. TaxID=278064 RepID=UPI0026592185|nr:type II CRISPR RNA-guided endonuclease Cas9 [uncultured Dialister sp.]
MMKEIKNYFIGLDMGTTSVGWAVTDENYEIIKKNGKALWGIRLFDEAQTAEDRRMHRIARRRIERRSRRIDLLQELFAQEICKKDPGFYERLNESGLHEEDKSIRQANSLFNDDDYDDKAYHKKYPTIYHLRHALMTENHPFDVRLVYLAIHHILKHRGHFLFENFQTDEKGTSGFDESFAAFGSALERIKGCSPDVRKADSMKDILKDKKLGVTEKAASLLQCLGQGKEKDFKAMMTLAAGGTASLSNIFNDEKLKDFEKNKVNFSSAQFEENEPDIMAELGDRYDLIAALHGLYNWSLLAELMGEHRYISEAKIAVYDKHKADLKVLKRVLKQSPKAYAKIFREPGSNANKNYGAYVGVCKVKGKKEAKEALEKFEKCSYEEFTKTLKPFLKEMPDNNDKDYISRELNMGIFLPKSVSKENGVIPYQLHLQELKIILSKAEAYLPFLKVKDQYGTVSDKIISLFTFRIPYYVGPINEHAGSCWVVKKDKQGKVYPWNFTEKIDIEKSAEGFIRNLTNKCTYLIGEDVLPKNSLLYSEFTVLNELNNVRIGETMQKLPLRLKEKVMDNLFSCYKHVSRTKFIKYLVSEGIDKKEAESISGLDGDFKSSLSSLIDMKHILGNDFSREDAEKMIQDITIFGGDKKMLKNRLHREFSYLTPEQLTSLTRLSYDGWGRLSREFLVNLLPVEGNSCEVLVDHTSGEVLNIISAMRQTSYNLMELLGSRFGYGQAIEERNRKEEGQGRITYKDVEDLYISPAVRRPLWQALKIVREIVKITGKEPSKIFIEMARENGEKGRRTISRKARLQALYKKCRDDTRDWAKELEGKSEEDFRSDRLYLYYTQMGRSMYTGKPIDINRLFDRNVYDIDHIYPQSLTGDDSLDNRVLVEKTVNAKKGDTYPLSSALDGCYISGQQIRIQDIQKEMRPFWHMLLEKELISKEKYNRLSRTTPLSDAEKAAFIGRQLVETRQSTKACAELLSKAYPQTRIVYTKAGNASRFRQYGGFIKVRDMNDYHHAKDAYLNIVVGNVFDTRFTANPLHFLKGNHPVYSLNTEALYGHKVSRSGVDAWIPAEKNEKGQVMAGHEGTMGTVRKWMRKNNILFTRMPLEGKGGLFDQNIMKKGKGQVPLKGDSPISDIGKYGGYNKASIAYMMLVQAEEKGKPVYLLESIPNYVKNKLISDKERQAYCVRTWTAQGNKYRHPQILIPKIRIQSLFEIDGFKAHISGKTDDRFVMRNAQELCMDNALAGALKNVLKFIHRKTVQKDAVITEYDGVSDDNTLALYDFFVDKLSSSIYGKKFATQADFLRQSKDKFMNLPLEERCEVLGSILHLFQCNAVLSDFHLLGGSRQAGRIYLNKKIKAQDHVYLIEQSVTGFFEKRILLAPFGEK